jgi:putative heme iron utilization protein
MADKTIAAAEARRLLLHEYHGVLSTLSADAPGYPFGSVGLTVWIARDAL